MICRDHASEWETQQAGVKAAPAAKLLRKGLQVRIPCFFKDRLRNSVFLLHAAMSSGKPNSSAILAPRSKATWHNAAEYVNGRGAVRTSHMPWSGVAHSFAAAVMRFLRWAHSLRSIDP